MIDTENPITVEEHEPRYRYDCGRCKFSWCCGPTCDCNLVLQDPPDERKAEVDAELIEAQLEPEFNHYPKASNSAIDRVHAAEDLW